MFLVFCLYIVWYFFSSVPLWRAFVTDNFSDLLAKWLELSSFSFLVSVNFLPHEFLWAHLRSTLYRFPSFFYCEVYFFKGSYICCQANFRAVSHFAQTLLGKTMVGYWWAISYCAKFVILAITFFVPTRHTFDRKTIKTSRK